MCEEVFSMPCIDVVAAAVVVVVKKFFSQTI